MVRGPYSRPISPILKSPEILSCHRPSLLLISISVIKHATNRELLTAPGPRVWAVDLGTCSNRASFATEKNAPVSVGKGFQHGPSTESQEVVIGMTKRRAGIWPGKSQLTTIGGGLHGRARQAERVAPDERGWRRPHPPPCNLYRLQTMMMTSLKQPKLQKGIR
jgi:hypothetical protein